MSLLYVRVLSLPFSFLRLLLLLPQLLLLLIQHLNEERGPCHQLLRVKAIGKELLACKLGCTQRGRRAADQRCRTRCQLLPKHWWAALRGRQVLAGAGVVAMPCAL